MFQQIPLMVQTDNDVTSMKLLCSKTLFLSQVTCTHLKAAFRRHDHFLFRNMHYNVTLFFMKIRKIKDMTSQVKLEHEHEHLASYKLRENAIYDELPNICNFDF